MCLAGQQILTIISIRLHFLSTCVYRSQSSQSFEKNVRKYIEKNVY